MRVHQKISRAGAERFAEHAISTAQFDVLAQLSGREGITQQELADRLLVTKGNISQLLDKMERRGWIVRCHEGRANTLYLTPAGKELARVIIPDHEASIAAQFASLSPDERHDLLRLLRTLDHALE